MPYLRGLILPSGTRAFFANAWVCPCERSLFDVKRAVRVKNRRTDADSWGGLIGLTWITGYWATLIPMWLYYIVRVLCPH